MEWLLGISVVLNILLLVVIAALIYCFIVSQTDAEHHLQEWSKWEDRFYQAQGILMDEHDLHLSQTGGAYGKMIIKQHK